MPSDSHNPKIRIIVVDMAETNATVLIALRVAAALFLLSPNGRPCVLNVTFCLIVLLTHWPAAILRP